MNVEQLREVIARNIVLDSNDDYGQEKCWKDMIEILTNDMAGTIDFFKKDCTDEEFYWLGSVFEDVALKMQSKEFIKVLRNRLNRVTLEDYNQHNFKSEHMRKWVDYKEFVRSVSVDIDYAEGQITE